MIYLKEILGDLSQIMNEPSEIATFYNSRVKKYGYSAEAVGWRSTAQQQLRFKMLTDGLDFSGSSVLDLGCGFGDLYDFLKKEGMNPKSYTGIDISSEMCEAASKIYSNTANIFFRNEELLSITHEKYDYVIASGSLNYNLGVNMEEYLQNFIELYSTIATKGLLFNLLSDKVDYTQKQHIHYSVDATRQLITLNFPKYRILQDYGLYEFTIQGLK